MSYFDTFISYSWMLLFIPIPYLYYFISNLMKIKKEKQKRKEREEELRRKKPYLFEPVISEEEKYLDIEIEKEDIPKYKKRIEELVMKLCEKRQTIAISSVEAMLLVELYSDSVVITDNGEFVIDINTAKKFSKIIMNDPRKFIKYIKSVEKKVDIGNKKKVELKEVLYLLRNARKFGLYIEDKKKDDLIFKVTSAIHDNDYNDVVGKIVDELQNENEDENFAPQKSQIILQNIANQNEQNIQPSNLESNKNVESFEKLDNGKIKIKLKNGTVIIKDDLMIYDVETPKKEEDDKKNNNKENESKADYNKLTGFEKKHIDKKLFKYRARWFFDMQLYGIRYFKYEQFKTDNILNFRT